MPHRERPQQRIHRRGMGVPSPIPRRLRRRVRVHARAVRTGVGPTRSASCDHAVDRPALAEEPRTRAGDRARDPAAGRHRQRSLRPATGVRARRRITGSGPSCRGPHHGRPGARAERPACRPGQPLGRAQGSERGHARLRGTRPRQRRRAPRRRRSGRHRGRRRSGQRPRCCRTVGPSGDHYLTRRGGR